MISEPFLPLLAHSIAARHYMQKDAIGIGTQSRASGL